MYSFNMNVKSAPKPAPKSAPKSAPKPAPKPAPLTPAAKLVRGLKNLKKTSP